MTDPCGANVGVAIPRVPLKPVKRRGALNSAADLSVVLLAASLIIFLLVSATQLAPFRDELSLVSSDGQGGSLRQATYLVLVAIIVGAARSAAPHRPLWPIPPMISLLLLWCAASTFWSLAPDITARRLLLTILIIYATFQSVQALGYTAATSVLSYAMFLILIVNYASVALISGAVHHANELAENTLAGSWRGILTHKNMTGGLCSFTAFIFMFESRQFSRLTRFIVVVASLYFLYRTQSKTSLGIVSLAAASGCLSLLYNPRFRALLVPLLILVMVGFTVALNLYLDSAIRQLGSSDDAFTGRIQIWRVLVNYIAENPWLGAGYQAFWNIGPNSPAYSLASGWVAHIIIGHSGYLDIASQIGIPGMIIAVAAMMFIPLAKIFASPRMPRRAGAMLVSLQIFAIGHNFTETSLLERDSFLAVTLSLTVALIYTAIRDGREAALAITGKPRTAWNPLFKLKRKG